jgi:hypothetical protein
VTLKQQRFISDISGDGKLKMKALADLVCCEDPPCDSGLLSAHSLAAHMVGGEDSSPGSLL